MRNGRDVKDLLYRIKLATMLIDLHRLKALKNELATRQSNH